MLALVLVLLSPVALLLLGAIKHWMLIREGSTSSRSENDVPVVDFQKAWGQQKDRLLRNRTNWKAQGSSLGTFFQWAVFVALVTATALYFLLPDVHEAFDKWGVLGLQYWAIVCEWSSGQTGWLLAACGGIFEQVFETYLEYAHLFTWKRGLLAAGTAFLVVYVAMIIVAAVRAFFAPLPPRKAVLLPAKHLSTVAPVESVAFPPSANSDSEKVLNAFMLLWRESHFQEHPQVVASFKELFESLVQSGTFSDASQQQAIVAALTADTAAPAANRTPPSGHRSVERRSASPQPIHRTADADQPVRSASPPAVLSRQRSLSYGNPLNHESPESPERSLAADETDGYEVMGKDYGGGKDAGGGGSVRLSQPSELSRVEEEEESALNSALSDSGRVLSASGGKWRNGVASEGRKSVPSKAETPQPRQVVQPQEEEEEEEAEEEEEEEESEESSEEGTESEEEYGRYYTPGYFPQANMPMLTVEQQQWMMVNPYNS